MKLRPWSGWVSVGAGLAQEGNCLSCLCCDHTQGEACLAVSVIEGLSGSLPSGVSGRWMQDCCEVVHSGGGWTLNVEIESFSKCLREYRTENIQID